MMYGDHYRNTELLKEITEKVELKFEGLNMVWCYKEHSSTLQIPEDYTVPEIVAFDTQRSFESVAKQFEMTHCKIVNKSCFVKENDQDILIMSKPQLVTSYESMCYDKLVDEKVITQNFVNDWLRNNPSQRSYDDIGTYPDKTKCPENHYNSWKAFAMESVKSYTSMPDELAIMRKHIKILCNNDDEVATYFEAWIAQMIQFPAVKSICPVLISKEGAGKGTLMRLLEKMMGKSKVFETATPSRDVWGDFNGRMASTFLINLNELSKKETMESEGRIKALITDPTLTINNKGVNRYEIDSYHRFLITTNKEEPVNSSKDDRRKLIVRSSDELIGNKEYFTKMYEMFDDVNVIKTCYEYFKSIPNMNEFDKLKMPTTTYHEELKEMSVSPLENWLKALTLENFYEKENVEIVDKKQFDSFKDWCKNCGIEYNLSSIQFGVRLKRLSINGISFGKHTKSGNTRIFNFVQLKEHFKINNIEVDASEDDQEDEDLEY